MALGLLIALKNAIDRRRKQAKTQAVVDAVPEPHIA
jgi:hypothetical protein